ncbi:L-amino-acid oxidase [Dissostichus eleginoides]|uniref:L-amino-acid oxidase n=1 Tax=Dissostichus eleginoides TaxID=100907 RepID=A0AAD9B619_DISEL|nr:L-amino-acid oxidase [Dissostichus eleginoides]
MITQDQKESRSNLGSTLDPAPAIEGRRGGEAAGCYAEVDVAGPAELATSDRGGQQCTGPPAGNAGASPVWVVTTAVRRHSEEHAPHRHSGRVHFYRGGRKDQGGEGFGPKRYPRCCTADR